MVKNTIPKRIDKELDEMIKEIAMKNEISFAQASRELAKGCNVKLKGSKISRDIKF